MDNLINEDLNAWQLLTDAWNYFWKHCPDPGAYYSDYMENADLDTAITDAEKILVDGTNAAR